MYGTAPALLLSLALALFACSGTLEPEPGPVYPGQVEIRLWNAADVLMEDVMVMFPEDEVDYGDLEPGAVTPYEAVGRAYRYAAVRAVVAGDTLRIIPVDYVGETLLDGGKYTYRLGLAEGESLTLEMFRD